MRDRFDSNPITDRFPTRTRTTSSNVSPAQSDADYVRKLEAELQRVKSNREKKPTKKIAKKRKRKCVREEDDDDADTVATRLKIKAFARMAVQGVTPPTVFYNVT